MRGTNGFGYCLDGEPTGDETPAEDYAAPAANERPCRRCGSLTTLSSRVCIECELDPARPAATVTPLRPARRAA
jgi:hypothetical protein